MIAILDIDKSGLICYKSGTIRIEALKYTVPAKAGTHFAAARASEKTDPGFRRDCHE
jgi:hypothetical protein